MGFCYLPRLSVGGFVIQLNVLLCHFLLQQIRSNRKSGKRTLTDVLLKVSAVVAVEDDDDGCEDDELLQLSSVDVCSSKHFTFVLQVITISYFLSH